MGENVETYSGHLGKLVKRCSKDNDGLLNVRKATAEVPFIRQASADNLNLLASQPTVGILGYSLL